MLTFNLLRKVKSIRNTITPYTLAPGKSGSKFPKVMFGFALVAVGAAAMVALGIVSVSYSPGQTPPVIIDFTGREGYRDAAIDQDRPDTVIEKDQPVTVVDSDEPAPDEAGSGDDPDDTVAALISRPIAQKAATARTKPESGGAWRIRFALCAIKKSCEEIIARLKGQGVNAYILEGVANVTTHRAIAGPWPTRAHVSQTRSKLKQDWRDSSIFTSGGRFFLSTEPLASRAVAEKECRIIKAMGSECRLSSKKEARKVYKVYEGAYKSKRDAVNRRMAYSRRGIDCIVERN